MGKLIEIVKSDCKQGIPGRQSTRCFLYRLQIDMSVSSFAERKIGAEMRSEICQQSDSMMTLKILNLL